MLAISLALLAAAATEPPTPTGINDSVLGKPEDFVTNGPATICTGALKIELDQGERVYLEYSGIHNLRLDLVGSFGTLKLSEGNAWASPRMRNGLVFKSPDFKFYDVGDEREFRYLAYGRSEFTDDGYRPIVWIDGDALRGNRSDRRLLARLKPYNDGDVCNVTYAYGWGVIMDGRPLLEKRP